MDSIRSLALAASAIARMWLAFGDLLREAITDLLEPRGDVSRAGRTDER